MGRIWRGRIWFCFYSYFKVSGSFLTSLSNHFSSHSYLIEIIIKKERRKQGERKAGRKIQNQVLMFII